MASMTLLASKYLIEGTNVQTPVLLKAMKHHLPSDVMSLLALLSLPALSNMFETSVRTF